MNPWYIAYNAILSFLYYVLATTSFSRLWDRLALSRRALEETNQRTIERHVAHSLRLSSNSNNVGPGSNASATSPHASSIVVPQRHADHEGDSPLTTPRQSVDIEDTSTLQAAAVSPRRGVSSTNAVAPPLVTPFFWFIDPMTLNYISLMAYGASRGTVLLVTACDAMPDAGTVRWLCVEDLPVFCLMLFSAAFINRWVSTIEAISLHMHGQTFKIGRVLVRLILTIALLLLPLAGIALYDVAVNTPYYWVSDPTWVQIMALYIGGVYTCNGLCFLVVGLYLARRSSMLIPESLKHIRVRLTATAILFGSMCTLRGVGVFLFFGAETTPQMRSAMNTWGLCTMLAVEWLTIGAVIFFVRSPPPQPGRLKVLSEPFVTLPGY